MRTLVPVLKLSKVIMDGTEARFCLGFPDPRWEWGDRQ